MAIYAEIKRFEGGIGQDLRRNEDKQKGIRCLVDYYIESLGWTESEAIGYAIGLFENGTIEKIKVIGENGKEI